MSGSKLIIEAKLLQGLLDVVSARPYKEVAHLLVGIQSKIQPFVEPEETPTKPKEVLENEG